MISEKFDYPREQFNAIIDDRFISQLQGDLIQAQNHIREAFGTYAGKVSPYIYQLCLSNTQSRRSRAGKTFERIIYALYEAFDFSHNTQAKLGRNIFKGKGLGKIVDSVLPSIEAFESRRDKVIIGTMKTTLRERWQEVIEEIQRTNLPKIYLLTVDDDISNSKVDQMSHYNVILVVYQTIKDSPSLRDRRNVISFENYFLTELPETFEYWQNNV